MKSSMKKFVVVSIGLLAIVLGFAALNDIINYRLVMASKSGNAYKMKRLVERGETPEICLIGNSRALEHFVPSEISPIAFNYGISGCGWRDNLFHLKCAINRAGDDVIICNLDPNGLYWGAQRGDYRFVLNSPLYQSEHGLQRPDTIDVFPGIRFFGSLRKNIAESEYVNLLIGGNRKTFDNGAIVQNKKSPSVSEWEARAEYIPESDFKYIKEVDDRIHALLSQGGNHQVVFVVSPVSPYWEKKFRGGEKFTTYLKKLEGYPRATVLDYRSRGGGGGGGGGI